jgi:crotonobetainyl-CoA hydratase
VAAVLDLIRQLETISTDDAMSVLRNNHSYRMAIESQDATEGTKAFAEKRAPKWQGK